jgi:hypothetical protein
MFGQGPWKTIPDSPCEARHGASRVKAAIEGGFEIEVEERPASGSVAVESEGY